MDDVPIRPGSPLEGQTLRDADIGRRTGVIVIAVKRADGRVEFPPRGDEPFAPGDSIVVLGRRVEPRPVPPRVRGLSATTPPPTPPSQGGEVVARPERPSYSPPCEGGGGGDLRWRKCNVRWRGSPDPAVFGGLRSVLSGGEVGRPRHNDGQGHSPRWRVGLVWIALTVGDGGGALHRNRIVRFFKFFVAPFR